MPSLFRHARIHLAFGFTFSPGLVSFHLVSPLVCTPSSFTEDGYTAVLSPTSFFFLLSPRYLNTARGSEHRRDAFARSLAERTPRRFARTKRVLVGTYRCKYQNETRRHERGGLVAGLVGLPPEIRVQTSLQSFSGRKTRVFEM